MGFCKECGAQVEGTARFCPECGAPRAASAEDAAGVAVSTPLRQTHGQAGEGKPEDASFGWAVLGFLVPIVGLVLYLVWKEDRPGDSLMAGKGALASVIVGVALTVLGMLLTFGLAGLVVAGL